MIAEKIINAVIFSVFIFIGFYIYKKVKKKDLKLDQKLLIDIITIVYIASVLSILILPTWEFGIDDVSGFYFRIYFVPAHESFQTLNITPFSTIITQLDEAIKGDWTSFLNLAGNLFIFLPVPIFVKIHKPDVKYFNIVISVFAISLLFEITQSFTGRISDIDDVILNTLGSVIGCGIYPIANRIIKKNTNKQNV